MAEYPVTQAMLLFADGSSVKIDFPRGNSIDEALAKLRTASTGERPTPQIGEDELREALERVVAQASIYEDFLGSGAEQFARTALSRSGG